MRIVLSPAKNMRQTIKAKRMLTLPAFENETKALVAILQSMDCDNLQAVMKINEKLGILNKERFEKFRFDTQGMPAILAYDGLQYRAMKAETFDTLDCAYAQEHICILDGLYGALKPYDSICEYRLEMKNKIHSDQTLYAWWEDKIYKHVAKDVTLIVNLASSEYSKVLLKFKKAPVKILTCTFKIKKEGRLKVESTQVKQARGLMVNWMVKEKIKTREQLKKFNSDGYRYDDETSTMEEFIYVRENTL